MSLATGFAKMEDVTRRGPLTAASSGGCLFCFPLEQGVALWLLVSLFIYPLELHKMWIMHTQMSMGLIDGTLSLLRIGCIFVAIGANCYALDAMGWIVCSGCYSPAYPPTEDKVCATCSYRAKPEKDNSTKAKALTLVFRVVVCFFVLSVLSLLLSWTAGSSCEREPLKSRLSPGCAAWPGSSGCHGAATGCVPCPFLDDNSVVNDVKCNRPADPLKPTQKCDSQCYSRATSTSGGGSQETGVLQTQGSCEVDFSDITAEHEVKDLREDSIGFNFNVSYNWGTWSEGQRNLYTQVQVQRCEQKLDVRFGGKSLVMLVILAYFAQVVLALKDNVDGGASVPGTSNAYTADTDAGNGGVISAMRTEEPEAGGSIYE